MSSWDAGGLPVPGCGRGQRPAAWGVTSSTDFCRACDFAVPGPCRQVARSLAGQPPGWVSSSSKSPFCEGFLASSAHVIPQWRLSKACTSVLGGGLPCAPTVFAGKFLLTSYRRPLV